MQELQMKALAEALAGSQEGTSSTSKSYVRKLNGRRLANPILKVFEDDNEPAQRTIVVIYTGDWIIIIIF